MTSSPHLTHDDPRLNRWLAQAAAHDMADLRAQLAENAVFISPVVHTPQVGIDLTYAYLSSADKVLGNDSFRYVQLLLDGDTAVLEFETEIDGIMVNGIDMIHWNADNRIDRFKVMVRPMKAMNKVWEMMGATLAEMKAGQARGSSRTI